MKKNKKFNRAFDQYQDYFFDLKLTTWNLLFIHTFSCWNNKHGNVKGNVSCASSRIHLLSIFEKLGQKLEVLLSFFCGTKITLEWITPLFLDLPPIITRWVQTMVQSFLCKHKCKVLSWDMSFWPSLSCL